jgi:DNA polymerase-4
MNAFFASVEQQEEVQLRKKPVIVVPVLAETTCAIAASYEAKRLGISTGTSVREAKQRCPGIKIVQARPRLYVDYHKKILKVLADNFASYRTHSIDEMSCKLSDWQTTAHGIAEITRVLRKEIMARVGDSVRCSMGIAPNIFLAKVASDMMKPDGLTIFQGDYRSQLFRCELTDLPGIGPQMLMRCHTKGVESVAVLWSYSPEELRKIWGGVVGERWYYMLRGSLVLDYGMHQQEEKKSVGHSHVLPPQFRTVEGARSITLRLVSKALKRLRSYRQLARNLFISVKYRKHSQYQQKRRWNNSCSALDHSSDDLFWIAKASELLSTLPSFSDYQPSAVGIVFTDLVREQNKQLSLFGERTREHQLCATLDQINQKFGHILDLACVYEQKESAPFRISFERDF